MAERRHKQETQKAPKTYNIKMPVYTTSMMEQEEGLFGRVTYQDMISLLKERLKSFSSPISTDNRNKTKKMVINKITPIDVVIGDVPSLLLQINAFNTIQTRYNDLRNFKGYKPLAYEQTCYHRKWI